MEEPSSRQAAMPEALLEVSGLVTEFPVYRGRVLAVAGISFYVKRQEVVGLIGETGCGKSVAALSLMRLIRPPGRITKGRILFNGADVLSLSERGMRRVRGRGMAMIFQKPMSSLDPVFTLERQFCDLTRFHFRLRRKEARQIAVSSLEAVALPDPEGLLSRYPHELSGGMQQRAMIAMALACGSGLLIADEPTTALDVSVQLQILKLIQEIINGTEMSAILISHDIGVIGSMCDRVYVMYAGQMVEHGPVREIVTRPAHPYSECLINAIPRFDGSKRDLSHIRGEVCDPLSPPTGCRFHPRCPLATDECSVQTPGMVDVGERHSAACLKTDEIIRDRSAET
jgi:oligopeptide/dipeptide ABC transporter ATP-binding protein